MHVLLVYVKEEHPISRDLSLENSAEWYLCLQLTLLHSVRYFFFFFQSPSASLCTVLMQFHLR